MLKTGNRTCLDCLAIKSLSYYSFQPAYSYLLLTTFFFQSWVKVIDCLVGVLVGCCSTSVLGQDLPKFADIDIEELVGVLLAFCSINNCRSIEVEFKV